MLSRYISKLKFYIFSNRFKIYLKIYKYFTKCNRFDFSKKSIRRKLKKIKKKNLGNFNFKFDLILILIQKLDKCSPIL